MRPFLIVRVGVSGFAVRFRPIGSTGLSSCPAYRMRRSPPAVIPIGGFVPTTIPSLASRISHHGWGGVWRPGVVVAVVVVAVVAVVRSGVSSSSSSSPAMGGCGSGRWVSIRVSVPESVSVSVPVFPLKLVWPASGVTLAATGARRPSYVLLPLLLLLLVSVRAWPPVRPSVRA